jgi:peroxiredoxin
MPPTSLSDRSKATRNCAGSRLAAWVLAFCALISIGPNAVRAGKAPGEAEDNLEKIENNWGRLIQGNAADKMESFLADNFQFVDAAGLVKRKEAYLDDLATGALRVESYSIEKITSHLFGDTAVVLATVGIIGQHGVRDISAFYQTTDTFVSRNGKWMAVSRQQTKIASRKDPLFERIGKPDGQPRIVIFVLGSFCPHCMTQLMTFAKELSARKLNVTVVSADNEKDLKQFPDVPFNLVSDPKHELFRKFGAYQEKPMHATLAVNGEGKVVFRHVGASPFMNVEMVELWVDKAAAADAISATRETDQ